ncbi:hypothetical protein [Salinisphaera orenii]|uniref:hypothetical protein n=1 Tax=Salinisphaera orenii TaxID=856731 RepID=UPI000DBE6667
MRVIIHIGTEKTGTTTLQETLGKNRKALRKAGIAYLAGPKLKNARDLAAAYVPGGKPDDYLAAWGIGTDEERSRFRADTEEYYRSQLEKARKKCHTAVLSSEHFHSRLQTADSIGHLKGLLEPYADEMVIVCYLRRQVDMVVSMHSTVLKSGGGPSFKGHTENMLRSDRYYCDYKKMLDNWDSVFGRSAIKARRFIKEKLVNGNIIDDFFRSQGLSERKVKIRPEPTNESVNHIGQVLLRELNRSIPQSASSKVKNNAKVVRRTISKAFAGRGEQLPPEAAKRLQSRFDEINEEVRKEYFPDSEVLFSKKIEDDDGRMLTSEQEEAVKGLVALVASDGEYTGTLRDYDPYADTLRDSADLLVGRDEEKAYQLMKLANLIRPQGGLIKKKLSRLEEKLEDEN